MDNCKKQIMQSYAHTTSCCYVLLRQAVWVLLRLLLLLHHNPLQL
jgi:hypothetical protein